MLETAQKQGSILKKYVKPTKDAEEATVGLTVDEKIAIQLSLDVISYGEEIQQHYKVVPANFPPFLALVQCYQANLPTQTPPTDSQ